MKWFHHDCSAKYDTKLQVLGHEYGPEGIGIYWMLLEEIGRQSDTFHIKVTGVSPQADQAYAKALAEGNAIAGLIQSSDDRVIPRISLKALAKVLFTTEELVGRIIGRSVEEGLFDEARWQTYGLLFSPAFEDGADNYTRRRRRRMESVRTMSAQGMSGFRTESAQGMSGIRTESAQGMSGIRTESAQGMSGFRTMSEQVASSVRTASAHGTSEVQRVYDSRASMTTHEYAQMQPGDVIIANNVPLEQTTEQEQMQKKRENQNQKENQNQREKETMFCYVETQSDLSTLCEQQGPHDGDYNADNDAVVIPSAAKFTRACTQFRQAILRWNEREQVRIEWFPTDVDLRKLFYGGEMSHKLRLAREGMNLMRGRLDYPGLVLRALNLMLEASRKQRIQNPFGWTWSCLHGTPEGLPPWVHLPTALEEEHRNGSPRPPP